MKKGIIIINSYSTPNGITNQVKRLIAESSAFDVELKVLKANEVPCLIKNNNVINTLPACDFVIYLDKDRYLAKNIALLGVKMFNSASSIAICDDKMLTHQILADKGINMPITISAPLCYSENETMIFLDKITQLLSFPLIVKENFGSLGKQVHLINDYQELESIHRQLIHKPHIFQEFIESSKGVDYRVIIIGDEVVASMKRCNAFDFRSNLACGGSSFNIELPASFKDAAIRAARIIGLDYCGVDLMVGKNNEPVLAEVNSNAFFEGIEKTTGVNIAKKYIEYILSKLK